MTSKLLAIWLTAFAAASFSYGISSGQSLTTEMHEGGDYTKPVTGRATLKSVFSHVPKSGFATFVSSTENFQASPLSAQISLTDSSSNINFRSSESISIGGQTKNESLHLLPLAPEEDSRGYGYGGGRSVEFKVASMSVSLPVQKLTSPNKTIAFSRGLTDGKANDFNTSAKGGSSSGYSSSSPPYMSDFLASDLPADWRAFLGFDQVGITSTEWRYLAAGVKDALKRYVSLGGALSIYHPSSEKWEQIGAPALGSLGLGRIEEVTWDGKPLPPTTASVASKLGADGNFRFNSGSKSRSVWDGLVNDLGIKSFGTWLVSLVLLGFAILVGPVNLFKLAPKGKRHKLFITTPIISIAASLILVLFILLQDGIGGAGSRHALAYLSPTDHAVYVQQQEVSRTGLLLKGSFELTEPTYAAPVPLDDGSRWTRLKSASGYYGSGQQQSYAVDGRTAFGGDFFQSRSMQGLSQEFIKPTRERLELTGTAEAPQLHSAIEANLPEVYVRFKDAWWKAPPLATGQSVALTKIPEATPALLGQYHKLRPIRENFREGSFLVSLNGDAANHFLQDSLTSISWKQNHVLLSGEVVNPFETKPTTQP